MSLINLIFLQLSKLLCIYMYLDFIYILDFSPFYVDLLKQA